MTSKETSQETPQPSSPFPPPNRHITTHDPATGKAIFSAALPSTLPANAIPGMHFYEAYTTVKQPIDLSDEQDIQTVQSIPSNTITFPRPGGVILRYCDWPPLGSAPLHRHETIDFGIVIHGEVEAFMDSGESRLLRAGDVLVQRNTLHGWRNPSPTEWVRVVFVIQGVEPVVVAGREMGEDLGAFGS